MHTLVLGTAQFGAGYGITNERGRLSDVEVAAIMDHAFAEGIRCVDTAAGYGDAQARLRPWADALTITTKVAGQEAGSIRTRLERSLAELGVESIDACLLHDWSALNTDEQQAAAVALESCRAAGLVRNVGISAYDETDLLGARAAFDQLDVVQVPANALDRRLDASPVVSELAAAGTRVQVRSVFLQGLLAAPSQAALGAHLSVVSYHRACAAAGRSPLAVALGHVRALPWASEIVVGVTSPGELDDIWRAWQEVPSLAADELASDDIALIDPRNWPTRP